MHSKYSLHFRQFMCLGIGENKIYISIFIVLFLLLNLTAVNRLVSLVPMMLLGFWCFVLTLPLLRSQSYFMIALGIIVLSGLVCNCFTENRNPAQALYIIGYAGAAVVIALRRFTLPTHFIFYITCLVYLVEYVIGFAGRNVFLKDGSFSTDIVLLLLFALMVILDRKRKTATHYTPMALLGFFCSFMSVKRMGIIIWALLLLLVLCWEHKATLVGGSKIFLKIATTLGIIFLVVTQFMPEYLVALQTRMLNEGVDIEGLTDSRAVIWDQYFLGLQEIGNVFCGVPFADYYWLTHYAGNVHNSFLTAHAAFGLFGLLSILSLLLVTLYRYLQVREYKLMTIFLFLLIRGLSDTIYFGQVGDFVLFAYIVYALSKTKEEKKENMYGKDTFNFDKT